jgi:hypothetical protein
MECKKDGHLSFYNRALKFKVSGMICSGPTPAAGTLALLIPAAQ